MVGVVVAALGWIGLVVVPGWLVCDALRTRAGLSRNLGLGVLVGIACVMATGELLELANLSIQPSTVLPPACGVPLGLWIWRSRGRVNGRVRVVLAAGRASWLGPALLAVGMLSGLLTWCLSIPSVSSVLPSTDGSHHALYAQRILTLHTLDPNVVLAGDAAAKSPTWHYYPLAIHLCAAMISSVTGVAVNTVLTVAMVLSAAMVLPLGIFVLTRRLFPSNDAAAGLAAIVSATFAWFPFAPILWGGIPTIVAMSQVPATVDAVWRRSDDGGFLPVGALTGLAGFALVQEHSSEVVTAALLGLALGTRGWLRGPSAERRAAALTGAVASGFLVALLLPSLSALRRGARERSNYLGGGSAVLGHGQWLLSLGSPLIALFTGYGLYLAIRHYRCWPLVESLALFVALYGLGFIDSAITRVITLPWYSSVARFSYVFAYFEAVLAGVGIATILSSIRASTQQPHVARPRLTLGALVGVVAIAAFVPAAAEGAVFVNAAYSGSSPVGPDQRAGFAWLAAHVTARERVLNEFVDGSGWMETLDGVHPLFATDPETLPVVNPQTTWGDRWYLLTHAANLATDARAQAAVRSWDIRYVYVSTRMIGRYKSRLSTAALGASPAYREVWHRGAVTIFSVDLCALT